jgi:type I restriction enzyme S subunit
MNTEKTITEIGLKKCNSKLYPKDTVFITARGTVGRVVLSSKDMAMNQSCYALLGKQGIGQIYLFLATREQVNYLKKNTGGATFDTIVVDTFNRMLVIRPDNEVIAQFTQLIRPTMELILSLLKINAALRSTRDLLLPKLMSGEVDVSELDIAIAEGG